MWRLKVFKELHPPSIRPLYAGQQNLEYRAAWLLLLVNKLEFAHQGVVFSQKFYPCLAMLNFKFFHKKLAKIQITIGATEFQAWIKFC